MGLILSIIDQNFPPKAKWSVDEVPDLTGKVALITGACIAPLKGPSPNLRAFYIYNVNSWAFKVETLGWVKKLLV